MTNKELKAKIKQLDFLGYTTGEIARKLNIAEYVVVSVLKKN